MPDYRRYVVHGRMPLKRSPQSGLFTTRFKEDAFFLDFNDRAVLFNSGARTEQSLQLPFYFVEKGYHQSRKLVESVGFTGAQGRLELFVQYAKLPVLDQQSLEALRVKVLGQADTLRKTLVERGEHQALLDMLQLSWCDEPILLFDYERANFNLRLKARAPLPPPVPNSIRTKRGRDGYFREYEDLLTSKAAYYLVSTFERLPFVQNIELNLYRMEKEPVKGLVLTQEVFEESRDLSLKRVDPTTLPPVETAKERKEREKGQKAREKAEAERLKKLSKEQKMVALTRRETDPADELFDGSLPHASPLLSAQIPRQGFMDLQHSKQSYSARRAMELSALRFESDEESGSFGEVQPFFE